MRYFNSQPRKGADTRSLTTAPSSSHFNSQPRKGADWQPELKGNVPSISTHSPARGLTSPHFRQSGKRGYFNSQPRKGADKISSHWTIGGICISTHSPARGLTQIRALNVDGNIFQLTAPQGD